ncbi:hypothetical protein D7Z54_29925 [Salibacterium salarium]|uniref:Uncharacterized protein n=1 Tax=Salibacterium salarium TaxID=284579 RepID=A0A3R9P3V6_9BACI|nr:hypothetical protein [Salibacterium salarium]RSL29702.1 hypothetical protein D7Z54_29925 [Salibacterium salarium]
MFESICISGDYDLGLLAEKALFYDKVKLIVNEDRLNRLFSKVHPASFISFLEEHRENIQLVYFWVLPAVRTFFPKNENPNITFTSIDEDYVDPYLDYLWEKGGLNSPEGSFIDLSLARRLYKLMSKDVVPSETTKKYAEEMENEEKVLAYLENYLLKTDPLSLRKLPRDTKLRLNVVEDDPYTGKKYEMEHNIGEDVLDPFQFLSSYFNTFSTMEVWANYSSDFQTSTMSSILIEHRLNSLYNQTIKQIEQQEVFNNTILKNRSIREVINSGEKNFLDYIDLYERSKKFKQWVTDIPPESNLVQEYINTINAKTWAEKLPSKTIRFGMFTGTGLLVDTLGASGVGTLLGTSLSAVDSFLLDKLITGWKPNHFIENEFESFLHS